jgi:hypothetical protein
VIRCNISFGTGSELWVTNHHKTHLDSELSLQIPVEPRTRTKVWAGVNKTPHMGALGVLGWQEPSEPCPKGGWQDTFDDAQSYIDSNKWLTPFPSHIHSGIYPTAF